MLCLYLRNSSGFPLTTGKKSPNFSAWWSGSSPHAVLPTAHTVPACFHWACFITPQFSPLSLVHVAFPTGLLFPTFFCPSESYHPLMASSLITTFTSGLSAQLCTVPSLWVPLLQTVSVAQIVSMAFTHCFVMSCVGPAHPEVEHFLKNRRKRKQKVPSLCVFCNVYP